MASWAVHSFVLAKHAVKCSTQILKHWKRSTSTTNIKTLQEAIDELFVTVGAQKLYSPKDYDRSALEQILPKSQEELPPRSMKDSFGEAVVQIGADEDLRQRYLNPVGGVRFGRILEDLDVFAVWLCYKHVLNPKQLPDQPSPFTIVTALVDHINVAGFRLQVDKDIKLSGHVSWVGKSSLETLMKLHQQSDSGNWQELLHAHFVMVARDPLNRGSAFVNPLIPKTPEEKKIFEIGEKNKDYRKKHADESLLKLPPNELERALIHDVYLKSLDPSDHSFKTRILPENCIWMEKGEMVTTVLCQPQEKNRFNKIFGGFIMRQAFELAWVNCYVFCKTRPYVTYVDDILFKKPVEIGSLLSFIAQIIYVVDDKIQTKVIANVINPETGQQDTTNIFYFTFSVGKPVRKVLPKTYGESMMYLDGKRHFEISHAAKHDAHTTA